VSIDVSVSESLSHPPQSCPWVGLIHGLGWVGSGFSKFKWVGLGWMGSLARTFRVGPTRQRSLFIITVIPVNKSTVPNTTSHYSIFFDIYLNKHTFRYRKQQKQVEYCVAGYHSFKAVENKGLTNLMQMCVDYGAKYGKFDIRWVGLGQYQESHGLGWVGSICLWVGLGWVT
jgi:hypothetical protein